MALDWIISCSETEILFPFILFKHLVYAKYAKVTFKTLMTGLDFAPVDSFLLLDVQLYTTVLFPDLTSSHLISRNLKYELSRFMLR